MWNKKHVLGMGGLVSLVVAAPACLHSCVNPITFHQLQINQLELRYGTISWSGLKEFAAATYSSGWNILWNWPTTTEPSFEDPRQVFGYVFAWLPAYAVVYPTEAFYYFSAELGGESIRGNLRLAEADTGRIYFSYFRTSDKVSRVVVLGLDDGLNVRAHGDSGYDLIYDGRVVHFVLPRGTTEEPKGMPLLPEEEYVGQIHDESGLRFFLLVNRATCSFYDILNEDIGVADTLAPMSEELLVGQRTGFVFYDDQMWNRRLLVGVSLGGVQRNDYFDGPADQVPFALNVRERIHLAYPHTMQGKGIDEQGVYIGTPEWMRVAISPYLRYASLGELLERVQRCRDAERPGDRWTGLTKEWWNTDEWRRDALAKVDALEGSAVGR